MRHRSGHNVFGQIQGSLGTTVCTSQETFVLMPSNVSYYEAATVPTVFITAKLAIDFCTEIYPEGSRLCIHSASGKVSSRYPCRVKEPRVHQKCWSSPDVRSRNRRTWIGPHAIGKQSGNGSCWNKWVSEKTMDRSAARSNLHRFFSKFIVLRKCC